MSSSGGEIGSTLTGGIQDISAILPLLGTEQCSNHVSSALTQGYLYAAATPMSIFGSLGMVTAGLKTLVACISFGNIEGAKILGNMGFEPEGENLSLIMVEGKNAERYIIETRIDELIKELNIDKKRITGVSHKSAAWNLKMIATTALLCAFSIAPYIYLNLGTNSLKKSTTWIFPVLRSTGGFITATLIQLLIQRRITTLSNKYLDNLKRDQQPNADVEAGQAAVEPGDSGSHDKRDEHWQPNIDHTDVDVELGVPTAVFQRQPPDTKKHQMDARTWLSLCLLLIGLVASVVGYVGCYSVVQNSTSNFGPVSWLCLEAGLSVMRLAIWAWNPEWDDAPPLEIILELDKYEHKFLPTCNKDNEEILQYKVLPLTQARDFLKIIMAFAGLIEPFSSPELSLYYTLTRKRPFKKSVPADTENRDNEPENENAEEHKLLGEWTLYITVFDHKELTTRVYTRDNEKDTFYSTKSDAPLVNVGHFILEVEIDAEIDPKGDPRIDSNNWVSLKKHHRSILELIQYQLGLGADGVTPNNIENSWTMNAEDTISTRQRLREENEDDWKMGVEKGKGEERNEELICDYFMHPSIERERRSLDEKRVKWIARRMEMITKETKETQESFQGKMGVSMVNKQAVAEEMTRLLYWERCMMEVLLQWEVNDWEQLFWNKFQVFLNQIGNGQAEVKEKLTKEWRADCWKRLNPQMHATEKRLTDDVYSKVLRNHWASSISQFFEGVEQPDSIPLFMEIGFAPNNEILLRMEKEQKDIEFRLKRGFELGRFDQFWDDSTLFECRYSRSKWLFLNQYPPLEIYSHALKENRNIIHITFGALDSDFDGNRFQADLPWVTSISTSIPPSLPNGPNPLFINFPNNDLITFGKEIRPKLNSFSTYIFTEPLSVYSGRLWFEARVLISFVAPSSQNLTLRLEHSGNFEITLGSSTIRLTPSSKSLTIDDITLCPIPASKSDLSFEPGIRNDIVIHLRGRHDQFLHDVELLDEAGGRWSGSEKPGIIDLD